METIYKIFYDYFAIELDHDGQVDNPKTCIYIAEYDTVEKFLRRVNYRNVEIPMDITVEDMEDMESLADNFESPAEALDALDKYLDEYKIWRTIYGNYYQPDEYICEGLEGR